ncbi:protein kinase domain-containing protein [Thermogutta sp.]|uniref:serine/threonine-protein kinase n=1 Tax=Thermogutta sp. TaxID=1962930 RepID=UPI003C7BC3D8
MIEGNERTGTPSRQLPAAKPVRLEEQPTVITPPEALVPVSSPEIGVEILTPKVSPGATLGSYEILEYIGGGGMGRVFRAFDARLSRVVALKVLTPEQAADPQTLARFQNEARSAARLNHPGIVQVYAAGEQDGIHYIAFEFIEGTNLRKLVEEKGPLPWMDAVRYILQVAEALDHASKRGVIHRDIKPSNIIVTHDGQAKLIDLGLARVYQPRGPAQDLTSSGTTLGTFDYIAPEQARDPRLADVRSDIYSLGCTLYYLLSGQPPFPGGTVLQKLLQHQTEEPVDIRRIRGDVPEALTRVLRRMMAKSPRQRFQSAAELAAALRELIGEGERSVRFGNGKALKNGKEHRWRRHLPWAVPLVTLLLTTLFIDKWFSHGAEELDLSGDEMMTQVELFSPPAPAFGVDTGSPMGETSKPAPGNASATSIPPVRASQNSPGNANRRELTEPSSGTDSATPTSGAGKKGVSGSGPTDPANDGSESSSSRQPSDFSPASIIPVPGVLGGDARKPLGMSSLPGSGLGLPQAVPPDTPLFVPPTNRSSDLSAESPTRGNLLPFSAAVNAQQGTLPDQKFTTPTAWIRWVDPTGRREGSFPTLQAACRAALPGDEIRLDFDGTLLERSLDLRGRRLKIVGERGRWPELVFRMDDRQGVTSESFVLLAASEISFENVGLRFEVQGQNAAREFACFQMVRSSRVTFTNCVVTLIVDENRSSMMATAAAPVVFESTDDPQSEILVKALASDLNQSMAGNIIEVKQSVIRGRGGVLRSLGVQGGELRISESLIAVDGRLLDVAGTDRTPETGTQWKVALQRVTAFCRQGLCRQSLTAYQWHLLPVRVESQASIFIAARDASFIEQVGMSLEKALRSFSWFGQDNFYEMFTRFWSITPGEPGSNVFYVSFESWMSYWRSEHEQNPAYGAIPWRNPLPLTKPAYLHQPSDYRLADPSVDDVAAEIAGKIGCPVDNLAGLPKSLP